MLVRAELAKLAAWRRVGIAAWIVLAFGAGFTHRTDMRTHRPGEALFLAAQERHRHPDPNERPEAAAFRARFAEQDRLIARKQQEGLADLRTLDGPAGAMPVAAGMMAQGPGIILALLVPCFLIGIEYQERTITTAAVLSGSRTRLLLAKLAVVAIVLATAFAAAAIGVLVTNLVFGGRMAPHVIPPTPISAFVTPTARVLFGVVLIQGVVAAGALLATTRRRGTAGALVVTAGVVTIDAIASILVAPWKHWSLSYNVSEFVFNARVGYGIRPLWIHPWMTMPNIPLWRSALEFGLVIAVLVALSLRTIQRAELT